MVAGGRNRVNNVIQECITVKYLNFSKKCIYIARLIGYQIKLVLKLVELLKSVYCRMHPITMQDTMQPAHRNIQEEVLTMQDLSGIFI